MTARDFNATPESIDMVARETVFQGYFRIDRYILRHARFQGGMGPEIRREILERGHAVAVLPYDPVQDAVVLIEQFRTGALAAGHPPWLLEIVAGLIDDGEALDDVARREAEEETGCRLRGLEYVQSWLSSPGAISETVSLFVGRVDADAVAGIHGLAEEGEDIRPIVVPVEEAFTLMREGRLDNATILISLQWLALNHEALRQRWRGGGA